MVSQCPRSFLLVLFVMSCFSAVVAYKKKWTTEDGSINFLVIGDWGGQPTTPYWTAIEMAIARGMGEFVKKAEVQFVVALGDNFYFDGVKDVEDRRFKETYDAVFNEPSLVNLDWYLIAGNHDHNGNVSAQIAYSKWEERWNFPDYYYRLDMPQLPNGKTVEFLMIDTILLCGNSDSDFLNEQPHGPDNGHLAEVQWQWLELQLQNSKADYLLVGGHYPVFSIGSHGPTQCLVDRLLPLLHKYSVTAYLCGHDHNLQHLEYTAANSTVQYFLSGAANFVDASERHESSVPPGSSKFFWANEKRLGGFGFVSISDKELLFTFQHSRGTLLYSKTVLPRRLQ